MRVTVTTLEDEIFNIEISEDLELENFKAFCEVESGYPASKILLVHHGLPLTDDKRSLKDLGLKDGDVLVLQYHRQNPNANSSSSLSTLEFHGQPASSTNSDAVSSNLQLPQFDFSAIQVPGSNSNSTSSHPKNSSGPSHPNNPNLNDPKVIRDILLSDPQQMSMLEQNNPAMADALKRGDFEGFSKMVRELQTQREEKEKQRRLLLSAEPFDVEAQRLIAEEIRQKNIDANMEAAMEFNPESFATVVMLYINCKVNGYPVKAFIDSGAQTTIMSTECAERCNIMRLVDTRFSGVAKGVGVQRIIGRVHMSQIEIGHDFLTTSFSILEDQKMDMLLGLDMLKRHQCVIDLKKGVLIIGTTNTETPFLPEAELPDLAKLTCSKTALNDSDDKNKTTGSVGVSKMGEDSGISGHGQVQHKTPSSSKERNNKMGNNSGGKKRSKTPTNTNPTIGNK